MWQRQQLQFFYIGLFIQKRCDDFVNNYQECSTAKSQGHLVTFTSAGSSESVRQGSPLISFTLNVCPPSPDRPEAKSG
jgi:hypothetical protein